MSFCLSLYNLSMTTAMTTEFSVDTNGTPRKGTVA